MQRTAHGELCPQHHPLEAINHSITGLVFCLQATEQVPARVRNQPRTLVFCVVQPVSEASPCTVVLGVTFPPVLG